VEGAAVEFNDHAGVTPNAVGLERERSCSHRHVAAGFGQRMAAKEARERGLELAAGNARAESRLRQNRAQRVVPTSPGVTVK
jgi:hypothetical protein